MLWVPSADPGDFFGSATPPRLTGWESQYIQSALKKELWSGSKACKEMKNKKSDNASWQLATIGRTVVGSFFVLVLLSTPVAAENADRQAAQFFDSVMSPYCPGRTLSACPSDDARILRDEIRARLAAGAQPEEVEAELKRRFGDISGGPTGHKSGTIAYIGIALFFVLGSAVLIASLRGKADVKKAD